MNNTIKNEFETYWESLDDDIKGVLDKMSTMLGWVEGRQMEIDKARAKIYISENDVGTIIEKNSEEPKPNGVLKQAAAKYKEAFNNSMNEVAGVCREN